MTAAVRLVGCVPSYSSLSDVLYDAANWIAAAHILGGSGVVTFARRCAPSRGYGS